MVNLRNSFNYKQINTSLSFFVFGSNHVWVHIWVTVSPCPTAKDVELEWQKEDFTGVEFLKLQFNNVFCWEMKCSSTWVSLLKYIFSSSQIVIIYHANDDTTLYDFLSSV